MQSLSRVRLCDPMDCSPPGSSLYGFFRQEYWSGLPFPPPGDLPHPGIELACSESPTLQADSFITEPPGTPQGSVDLGNDLLAGRRLSPQTLEATSVFYNYRTPNDVSPRKGRAHSLSLPSPIVSTPLRRVGFRPN